MSIHIFYDNWCISILLGVYIDCKKIDKEIASVISSIFMLKKLFCFWVKNVIFFTYFHELYKSYN